MKLAALEDVIFTNLDLPKHKFYLSIKDLDPAAVIDELRAKDA